ncbi:hypothetical protein HHI36_002142 [Cryptolaemus montrouzieri]|uniref:Uncharacterized protein n=1 Tax=Cryptolaemus montrouzieri TaxID=559131 RepID=A0ABD2PB01_9CUCU
MWFPRKYKKFKSKNHKLDGFWYKNLINEKKEMYKIMKEAIITEDTFKKYRKILRSVMLESERREKLSYIKTAKIPGKAMWNLVNWYRGKNLEKKESNVEKLAELRIIY